MSGLTLLYVLMGLIGFGAGAYLSATGERTVGIIMMGGGLVFQVLALRSLKMARMKGGDDASR